MHRRPHASLAIASTLLIGGIRRLAFDAERGQSSPTYSFAVICVAVAASANVTCAYFVGHVTPSTFYYAAILVATLAGGIRAGIASIVLSAIMVWWALDTEFFRATTLDPAEITNRLLYVTATGLIIWLAEHIRRSDGRPTSNVIGNRPRLPVLQRIVGLRPNSPGAFAFALGCVVIATLLRLALTWAGDNILPFACYFPAVLLAALVGGLLAGVFAIALSLTIVAWAFFPPYYVFAAPTSEQVTNLALYALVSLLAIWATESGRRALIRWRIQVDLLGILAPMLVSLAAVLLTTIVLASIDSYIDVQELVLAYLFPTTLIAIAYGSMLAFLASFASGLAAAYFLFPPKLSLYIADPLHVAELGFFLLLALLAAKVASSLADDLRHEKKVSRRATRTRGAD